MTNPSRAGLGGGFDAVGVGMSRDTRQALGHALVMALGSLLRNARSYAEDNDVFGPALTALQESMLQLLSSDGLFELELNADGVFINRQAIRFDANTQPLVDATVHELAARGVTGISALLAPPRDELRALLSCFTQRGPPIALSERGDPRRPLQILTLHLRERDTLAASGPDRLTRLVDAYAHAVFFVDRTIEQLRTAGEAIPLWAVSRVVQDLVDLERLMPRRFLMLSRTKPPPEEYPDYFGHHSANVAVLAIAFGARLGFPKRRRHDLGLAALLHDVGVAALPPSLLLKTEVLSQREKDAMRASPLFAARAILRDREVHAAALDRALAAYECHLDLVPPPGDPLPEVGMPGRILALCEAFDALTTRRPFRDALTPVEALRVMQVELVFRFDPLLLDVFPRVIEALLPHDGGTAS
ncbi:MAG: hypothetical protein JST92_06025 [Deltaproteobacteria bacterium]|nr:hypothetical protein [Deltaproteobacteria bacterium]